jgi:hypothetical protein
MKPQLRSVLLPLLAILCLALSAPAFAQTIFFDDGPIDGMDTGLFVTGPNQPNLKGSVQDISDGFVATGSGTVTTVTWAEWSVGAPTSFAYSLADATGGHSATTSAAQRLRKMLGILFCSSSTAWVIPFTRLRLLFLAALLWPRATRTGLPSAMPPTLPAMVRRRGTLTAVPRPATIGKVVLIWASVHQGRR